MGWEIWRVGRIDFPMGAAYVDAEAWGSMHEDGGTRIVGCVVG